MKRLLLALLVCGSVSAFAQKTNFSGAYNINLEKTKFGPAPQSILPKSVVALQAKDNISITKTPVQGEAFTEVLKFDGTIASRDNEQKGKNTTSLKWNEDKLSFVLDKKATDAEGNTTIIIKETWTTEDGGKTLVLTRDVDQVSNGMKYTTKGYFDKQ